jgi:molybdopterin/thiamine biosynthesis adenylyltransferase
MSNQTKLSEIEKDVYEWQLSVHDFGVSGQTRLKSATVFISRIGGLGSLVAYELAAAGIGRLILAHAGNIKPSDLNRQILMTHDAIGTSRIESARKRLLELNPRLEIEVFDENVCQNNASRLMDSADMIVDCAPVFEERFLMNRHAVCRRIPLVECAIYELELNITTILPGQTPCLRCLYPQSPSGWKREFPVFGAVSGTVGCLAAMEAVKVLAGFGEPLYGRIARFDLRQMKFETFNIYRNPDCTDCGHLTQ